MNYLIYARDFVIYRIGGDRAGTADHKTIRSFFLGPSQPVSVAAVKTSSELFEVEDKKGGVERILASSFGEGYTVQHERLDSKRFQVFGIEKSLIEEIHSRLDPEEIKLITPYALAIRRYIDSLNIETHNRYILFLELIKERDTVLLSFFYRRRHLTTRAVKYNLNTLNSEIVRDIQSYSGAEAINFICITNSSELGDSLCEKEVFKRDEINIVSEPYPSIKGLEIGCDEFPHFIPESEVLEKEKLHRQKRDLAYLSLSAVCFIFCLIVFLVFFSKLNNKKYEVAALETKLKSVEADIIKANRAKYIDYYSQKGEGDLSSALARFCRVLPSGSTLDSFFVTRQDTGYLLVGYLIKKDITSRVKELRKALDIFPGSTVENVVIKELPGYKVTLCFGTGD